MPVSFADSAPLPDTASAQHTPSLLFLTQNLGGLVAPSSHGPRAGPVESSPPSAIRGQPQQHSGGGRGSGGRLATSPAEAPLSAETKQRVQAFVLALREWVHRAAAFHQARQAQAQAKTDADAAGVVAALEASYTRDSRPPQFDAVFLHFQEVGGKARDAAFTTYFAGALATGLLPEAGWSSGLLMNEDAEDFTAIASVVLLSPRMCAISSMLSFPHRTYVSVADEPRTYGGSARHLFIAKKFSNAGRSRKGFVLASMRLGSTVVNCCNVHLFHDADNTVALDAANGAPYVRRRREALLEALAECGAAVSLAADPFLVFGDFNCRLDGPRLAAELASAHGLTLNPSRADFYHGDTSVSGAFASHGAAASIAVEREDGEEEEDREGEGHGAPVGVWDLFATRPDLVASWHERFDAEPAQLCAAAAAATGPLAELPVRFPPTYSRVASEGSAGSLVAPRGRLFQRSRLPAWCDRVLFNAPALELLAGGRGARPSVSGPDAASGEGGGAGLEGLPASVPYLYSSVCLPHTDHDGVFLLV